MSGNDPRWMEKAFAGSHGQLRSKLGAKKGRKIAADKLRAATGAKGKLGRQARLAMLARQIHAKGGG